ncbi:hypothetical protein [Chiayiivirga flava]|uniref:Glycosyltransferase RgtA/B/C/D-like domain-containing protein n=1 Tax=Chiayiivirga flava TaxID=659595 RepID=A0A7W8D649_9GAMM|nr:hypothetical protein [Chiayiivirga flava]MBB5206973.1 hypothetical protein [Chiayiivirga flava]
MPLSAPDPGTSSAGNAAADMARARTRQAWLCVALVLAAKAGAALLDTTVRLFMGDSGSYLLGALTGWVPGDRSFLYGWMIGATAVPLHSIHALFALQTLFGVGSAMLLYAWLRRGVGAGAAIATLAAVAFALEPAQLFYERMVMAESAGLLALALFFAGASVYVRSGRWYWIAVYVTCGLLAVAMRLSLLPMVLVLGLLAPLVRGMFNPDERARAWRRRIARTALHAAVAAAFTFGLHSAYTHWYGALAKTEPGYIAQAGMFRLGLVLPLVHADHLRASGIDPALLDELAIDPRDPRRREAQLWLPGGMQATLRRHTRDADAVAGEISMRALRDDPLGLVRMGLATVADYFDPTVAVPRLHNDLGRVPPDARHAQMLLDAFGYDISGVPASTTPAVRWFAFGAPWLVLCLLLLAPLALAALALGWRAPGRDLRVLLCLASLGLVAQHVLFSHIVSYRYLHPLPWFMLANGAALAAALRSRLRR